MSSTSQSIAVSPNRGGIHLSAHLSRARQVLPVLRSSANGSGHGGPVPPLRGPCFVDSRPTRLDTGRSGRPTRCPHLSALESLPYPEVTMPSLVSPAVALVLLVPLGLATEEDEDLPVLRPGETIEGESTDSDAMWCSSLSYSSNAWLLSCLRRVGISRTATACSRRARRGVTRWWWARSSRAVKVIRRKR